MPTEGLNANKGRIWVGFFSFFCLSLVFERTESHTHRCSDGDA